MRFELLLPVDRPQKGGGMRRRAGEQELVRRVCVRSPTYRTRQYVVGFGCLYILQRSHTLPNEPVFRAGKRQPPRTRMGQKRGFLGAPVRRGFCKDSRKQE